MAKVAPLPALPKVKKSPRKLPSARLRPEPAPPRKFRSAANIELAKREREKWAAEQAVEKSELDKKIEANAAKIAVMRENQDEQERKAKELTLDEQVLILQAHFENGIGVKTIAKQLGRNHSTVSRFLSKYKSTSILAKAHLQNNAERLARRVIAGADVDQSLEVLDRMDVLPKKERGKESAGGNTFQVMVAMPSQQNAPVRITPSQKTIEAAKTAVVVEEPDGDQD